MSLVHLGIIADGNRRWAKAQGLPTIEGHKKGLEVIEELVASAGDAGIEYITFYVFSTENWGRSTAEVSYIMKLAETRILKYAEKLAKNNARMLILGSKEKIFWICLSKTVPAKVFLSVFNILLKFLE